jgi:hypothetical protein
LRTKTANGKQWSKIIFTPTLIQNPIAPECQPCAKIGCVSFLITQDQTRNRISGKFRYTLTVQIEIRSRSALAAIVAEKSDAPDNSENRLCFHHSRKRLSVKRSVRRDWKFSRRATGTIQNALDPPTSRKNLPIHPNSRRRGNHADGTRPIANDRNLFLSRFPFEPLLCDSRTINRDAWFEFAQGEPSRGDGKTVFDRNTICQNDEPSL